MKKLFLTTMICLAPSLALATNPTSCQHSQQQQQYHCTVGDTVYTIEGASSEAEAAATAAAYATAKAEQEQNQGQAQSQTSENTNVNSNSNNNSSSAVNGGNSVSIEGDPAHTTSIGLGVSVGVTVPLAQGYQMKNAIDAANWFMANGQSCVAYAIMADAPRVKRLGIKYNCGDKG